MRDLLRAVGQFRELVQWAEEDRSRCESVKKVLKLTKGWDVARDHALTAVRACMPLHALSHNKYAALTDFVLHAVQLLL